MPPRTATNALASASPCEALAVRLGVERFGVDILRVQEIRSYERPTRIAHAPQHLKGVVNLRGAIVPVVDLRVLLRLDHSERHDLAVTVVLRIGHRSIGVVVDAVDDVVALGTAGAQLVPAPDTSPGGLQPDIDALDPRPLRLLDIDKLLSDADVGPIASTLQ